jgi:beta-glucosidase
VLPADTRVTFVPNNLYNRAVLAARSADLVIVVVGNRPTCDPGWKQSSDPGEGKEAVDRQSLELSDEVLIRQVWEANSNTVVVLQSSFPYVLNWTQAHVPAIL